VRRAAAISAVAVAALVAVTLLVVQSALVRRPLLEWVTDYLRREAGLHLAFEEFRYSLLARRVTARGVTLAAVGHETTPLFTADALEVRLPWEAYRGRLVFQSITLEGARVVVATGADGVSNLPPADPEPTPPPQTPRRIDIRGLTIRGLDFEYRHVPDEIDIRVGGLSADLEGRMVQVFAGVTGPIAIDEGVAIRIGERRTASGPVEGRLAFDGSTVSLQGLTLSFPEADLTITGRVLRALDASELDLRFEGMAHLAPAAAWGPPPTAVDGMARVEGTIAGPTGALVIDTAFDGRDLALGQARRLGATGRVRLEPGVLTVEPLTVEAGGGRVTGTVVVPFDEDTPLTVDAAWRALPLDTVLAIAEQGALPLGAALDGTLRLSTGGREGLEAHLDTTTRGIAARDRLPLDGRVEARISRGQWQARVDQRTPGVRATAEASGTFDERDVVRSTLSGPLDVRVTDFTALARSLAVLDVTLPEIVATADGQLTAALQLGGTFAAPSVAGAVASEELVLADVGPTRLNLMLEASTEGIRASDLRLRASETTVDADVSMDLVSRAVTGSFRAEVSAIELALTALPDTWRPSGRASASGTLGGTLDAIAVDAEVTTGTLVSGVQQVDSVRADLRVRGDTVHVDRLEIAQGDGRLEASGRYTWTTGGYGVRLDARGLVVEDVTGDEGATRARVDLTFEGEGTVEAPEGDGRATIEFEGGTVGPLVGRTTADIRLDGEHARIRAHVPDLGTFVDATVRPRAPFDYRAVVVVHRLDLVPLALMAGAREAAVDGTLSLSALLTGRADDPASLDAAINVQRLTARAGGVPVTLAAPSRLRWTDGGLTADALTLMVGEGELRASGRFSDEVLSEWRTTIEADAGELVAIARAFGVVPDALTARGAVQVDWRSSQSMRQADASISLDGGALIWDDLPPVEALSVRATFDGTTIDVPEIAGTWQGGGVTGAARLPRALFDDEADAAAARAGFFKVQVRGLTPSALAPWVEPATLARMTGAVSATIDAAIEAPSLTGLRGTVVLDEATLTLDGVPIEQRAPSRFMLADGRLSAADVEWLAGGSPLRLSGGVQLDGDEVALDLELSGRADLRILSALEPSMASDGGADLDVRIGGTPAAPLLSGRITLDGAELALREPQVVLSDVSGRIDLDGERMTFQEITGEANGGRMVVVGGLTHRAFELTGGTVILQLQGAAFEFPAGLQSEVDALLQFAPEAAGPRLFGDVRVLRSGYLAPISLPALAAGGRGAARPIRVEPSYLDTIRLNVAVETVTDMVVDNNYGRFEAGAQLRLVGTIATPGLVGRATLREGGQVFLAGNTFRVERGSISFIGQTAIEPDFDIEIRTIASGQDVTVTLSGTLDRLETDVRSSDPNLATDELVSLLLGGTGAGFGGADALRLFSAELLGATGRAFGLDSLRLERGLADEELRADPGQIADQTDPSARLTLSKRIRPDVEVIFSQNLRDSGLSAILSYRPRRNVEIRGISRDNQDRAYSLRHEIAIGGARTATAPRPVDPRVASVSLAGPALNEAALLARLRLDAGARFNFHAWQRDIDALRAHFHDQGRLEARVRASRQADEAAGTVALTYRIDPGPFTVLQIDGHPVPDRLRSELEGAWTRAIFDQFLVQDLQSRVRRFLIRQGWHGSVVRAEVLTDEDGATKTARVSIDPGTRVARREIRFQGRDQLDEGLLRRAIDGEGLEVDAWITPERLRQPLEDLYAIEGYLDARVRVGTPGREGDRAVLVVSIEEGPRYLVGDVTFDGVAPARDAMAVTETRLDAGGPFAADVIERARRRLEAAYLRQGFNSVRVDVRPEVDEPASHVDVTFVVEEGPQQVLSEVAVSGASRTREGVVERALRLRVGEPVDLSEWALARKRLYDTNVFRQVDLLAQPLGDPEGGLERVLARVTVQEWPDWRFRYGLQLNDERASQEEEAFRSVDESVGRTQTLGIVGDLRSQNLFGRAIGTGISGRLEPSRRGASTFLAFPGFFRLPVTTSVFVFGERQDFDFGDAFSFVNDRTGASVEQRWRRTRATQIAWSYRFERNHTFEGAPDPADDFPLDFRSDVARFSVSTLVDRRDDPFNARRGWFSSVVFEYAAPEIGSDLRLAKLFAQQRLFRPVGRFVLAGNLQAGAAFAADLIPSERFRAGGGYTVRGYAEDSLGPLDFLGRPRGGNALLVANYEARFPMYRWVRGVAFLDMGNVFASRDELSFNNLKVGYGIGLRLDTPFALIRVDYGIPTDRRPRDPRGRWYIGIGQVF
jgi:outer membrane protein assembly complex protein YaeT